MEILETLMEHKKLLELLGYTLDLKTGEIPFYKSVNILSNDKVIGTLSIERTNLYFLKKDKKIVVNMDLNSIYFGKDKEKNTKTMFHTIIKDKKVNIDCYNGVVDCKNDFSNRFLGLQGKNFWVTMRNGMIDHIGYNDSKISFKIDVLYLGIGIQTSDENMYVNNLTELKETFNDVNDKFNNIVGNNLLENLINAVNNNQNVKKNTYKLK